MMDFPPELAIGALPVILAALCGLLIGSFLNVVIYRLPRDLSVVRPRSHCPGCGHAVRAWDNIPVISYLILRGRCRDCRTPIPLRYPLVEAITALAFAWFVGADGLTWMALRDCIFSALLIALAFTDLETRLLPEPLTAGGIVIGLGFSWLVRVNDGTAAALGVTGRLGSFLDALMGAVAPALLLWIIGWLFEKLRKKQGLGFGDVVMIAEVGAFLGVRAAFLTLVAASIAGSVIGIAYILLARKDHSSYELPLGSFLGFAGIFVAAFGAGFIRWYSGFF